MAKRAKTETTAWDAVQYLKSNADMALYLQAAFEEGDPTLIAARPWAIPRAPRAWRGSGVPPVSGARACTRRSRPAAIRNLRRC